MNRLIQSLQSFGESLPALIIGISDDDSKWKPPSGNWSVLEIVCHLIDEEIEDFRHRLEMTLRDPSENWPAIDPPAWAIERNYNEQVLAEKVEMFVSERKKSVDWLKSLADPDWNCTYNHDHFGPMKAGDLLAAWSAHDFLHSRQIAKRRYEMVCRDASEYKADYAGGW